MDSDTHKSVNAVVGTNSLDPGEFGLLENLVRLILFESVLAEWKRKSSESDGGLRGTFCLLR